MSKYKHLTYDERLSIQKLLSEGKSFAFIAEAIGKHRTAISKKIRSHIVIKRTGVYGKSFNDCMHGKRRSRIFYCNASSPYQKGAVENNHEFIRRILPKGTSFNELTQEDINLIMSHINSYKRKKLNDKSPLESFSFFYGHSTAEKLHIEQINPDDIILDSTLLR